MTPSNNGRKSTTKTEGDGKGDGKGDGDISKIDNVKQNLTIKTIEGNDPKKTQIEYVNYDEKKGKIIITHAPPLSSS